ncbi:tetratricopeptide repeat protein [Nocardia asteroides]|uniref:tetratricopeptide repeat protein n=1 Tax=Nocardia asteroides TaxID=1824 RepID=UPI001E6262ED|nr:tetratricopeptide repeat protein [Nocardia asteroides]UGT61868.1 tetratricopeptide repeat protein [Nocardia asteroides]
MNRDVRIEPSDGDREAIAEIAELFGEIAESVAALYTPARIDAGLGDLLAGPLPVVVRPAARRPVRLAESLADPARDTRIRSGDDRVATGLLVTGLRELLTGYPVRSFGAAGSGMVLESVAKVAEALIADRDERTALRLIRAAVPHLRVLGGHDHRGFRVRRAWAEAWSELGEHRRAERLLGQLRDDERRVHGAADPRTEMLLLWALGGRGRLAEAAAGFQALALDRDTDLARHLACRRSWVLGKQGATEESIAGYRGVIAGRSAQLGADDAETLDARHSLAKMLVGNGAGEQAVLLLESLLADRARVLGAGHPDTLESAKYLHLARVQAEPLDARLRAHAIEELRSILHSQALRHGLGHPTTRDTTARLRDIQTGVPRWSGPVDAHQGQ